MAQTRVEDRELIHHVRVDAVRDDLGTLVFVDLPSAAEALCGLPAANRRTAARRDIM